MKAQMYKVDRLENYIMSQKDTENDGMDISLITQAAVGYVKDHSDSKRMAEKFVAEVRVHLGQILQSSDLIKESPLGNKASSEAKALWMYVEEKVERLESERGYAPAQASAIVLKDDLVPLQMVAGMANDPEMIASVRKVNSHVISELGNLQESNVDPKTLMKRKKRGRAPGSGKKPVANG
jgi:hypothetical protein